MQKLRICRGLGVGAMALVFLSISAHSQRVYAPHSVLSTGNWYKISVSKPGIHKIDISFLQALGINASGVQSSTIRLYGNAIAMLPEDNASSRPDDLVENAIQVVDGGDGIFDGSDYILFYSPGPDQWQWNGSNFSHIKNLYSNEFFYFISIGGNGKRIQLQNPPPGHQITVSVFDDRLFHELDTVNLLGSGKQWLGEEFANVPGKTLSRSFSFAFPNLIISEPLTLRSSVAARSPGSSSRFDVVANNQLVHQLTVPAITGSQYDVFAREAGNSSNFFTNQSQFNVSFQYTPGGFNSQGWLNWFELFARRSLQMTNDVQLLFRDTRSVGNGNAEFVIINATANTKVWDVTDIHAPIQMQGNYSSGQLKFVNDVNSLREYVAFDPTQLLVPKAIGKIFNQDLHAQIISDYLIIVHPPFLQQAERLANFHRQKNNLRTLVVTTEQVFNEFSSGISDPAAIRDFIKMFYDRNANPDDKPKYVLLFGDGSFDYKNRINFNTNFVPAYQTSVSFDPLQTYTSDDFFGFLDDNENINAALIPTLLDVGIGRVPAKHVDEARSFVDKVIAYYDLQSFGPWRNQSVFIADDEDQNLHLQDAETVTAAAQQTDSVLNIHKIYLDAYLQQSGAGGSRYPQANESIDNHVLNGVLIWNYLGHGGPSRLAEEIVLDQEIVNRWRNENRLPLFVTATCDFAPFDNPFIFSIGENLLLRPKTGSIALMTTTRVVFAFSNKVMNETYMRIALQRKPDGKYRTLGEAMKDAKNEMYQGASDITNNRKFTLIGDPAMRLAFPEWKISPTRINGQPISVSDTLKAMEIVEIEGEVTDLSGNILPGFNGTVYPIVYDKPSIVTTIANDPTSIPVSFSTFQSPLFRGKSSVVNGKFSFRFRMPRDIQYQLGKGRMSFYANDLSTDAGGSYTNFQVGGISSSGNNDTEGPEIEAFLNDESFVNGGLTNENPVLVLNLSDSSGINTAGTGIGHDLVATLDGDNSKYFVLNDFYEGELDNYQKGSVRFQIPTLSPGNHTLKIKAWDVLNNSSETIIDFTVVKNEDLVLAHVLNYPNPFTNNTSFWFEHNKAGEDLHVSVTIFTITGKTVKNINKTINNPGNRSSDVTWDGRDEYGDQVARGIYLYRLQVRDLNGKKAMQLGKLVKF